MSAKHNKYVVNQKLEHFDDISFRELFGRISGVLQNKICLFIAQGICIYVGHFFYEKQLDQLP
jgi:TfoX/Sxy family transcriptional regulator of competence genes